MAEFVITERCTTCGHKWKFRAMSMTADASDIPDPACPKCSAVQQDIGLDVGGGRAPAFKNNPYVKAMDVAADITMKEYGLTDLKSDGRPGSTMAPSIRPDQQAAADGMFDKKKRTETMGRGLGPTAGSMIRAMTGAALSGRSPTDPSAQAPQAIKMIHEAREKPAVNVLFKG